jgi:hypothetical protein
MDEDSFEPLNEPHIDPRLGTERQTRIGGWWRDLFTTRMALALMVLLWVGFLVWILWWFLNA